MTHVSEGQPDIPPKGVSVRAFRDRVLDVGLIPADRFDAVLNESSAIPSDGHQCAEVLTKANLLTNYQASVILGQRSSPLVLNNYLLLDDLGSGGMGHVFQAMHRRMERVVAIKVLPAESIGGASSVARFHREVKAAARLVHPNVVTAFDADVADGIHYLVMEYVDGCDLARLLKDQGPLEINQAIDCIIQAAQGLAAAHESGIFHRDVKPANLLLNRQGVVKVLDMGLAQFDPQQGADQEERLTIDGQIMGTYDFISPEQIASPELVDVRSDVYSLGCTLFALLTGSAIYDKHTTVQKLVAHQSREIPSLREQRPDVPDQLEMSYQKMVAKSQGERLQSMAEVISVLSKCFPPDQPRLLQPPPRKQALDLNAYLKARSGPGELVGRGEPRTEDTVKVAGLTKAAGTSPGERVGSSRPPAVDSDSSSRTADSKPGASGDGARTGAWKPWKSMSKAVSAIYNSIKRNSP